MNMSFDVCMSHFISPSDKLTILLPLVLLVIKVHSCRTERSFSMILSTFFLYELRIKRTIVIQGFIMHY